MRRNTTSPLALMLAAPMAAAIGALPATAAAFEVEMEGYVRQGLSMNLQNPRETDTNDAYRLSMSRSTMRLDTRINFDDVSFTIIARGDREYRTPYLRRLERAGAFDSSNDRIEDYYNNAEIREAYMDLPLTRRISTRIGKQQLAWGETDFFQANDLIHGFDFSWRSFLEGENEELRKPLIMATFDIDVPEVDGNLQLFFRPGFDRKQDIGNTFDIEGGRWALQPNKGVDFQGSGGSRDFIPYDYEHPEGRFDEQTFGVRWSALTPGGIDYSLMYLRHHNPDPVHNAAGVVGEFNPYKGRVGNVGAAGSFIFPIVDTIGATASGYAAWADAVFSTEIAYTFDKPYNFSSDRGQPIFAGGEGSSGIKEKDTVSIMFRMDKIVDLTNTFLRTSRPSFASIQLFNTWIPSYSRSDNLVSLVGYEARQERFETFVTGILGLNYNNDRINPQLAVGSDLNNGGAFFVIPSVEFAYGDNWRVLVEADLFFPLGNRKKSSDDLDGSRDTRTIGYFDRNNQLYARFTYNF
ncbi:LysR family transcriptional regulator [Methylonatrum kenyense]|uniref:DUF1302 family protein n=1 Tax=Methylonatrum kenyense TaxID=455253 RepID=UPI0020BDC845|nr:DUF1302 family protein [Methylonatrum kenyense]MCK8514940.1 LysR family transcriptional regulator [Methylonatrum kenyense]